MTQVYCYKAYNVWHCAASKDAVVTTFGEAEKFWTYFGGGVTYGLPSDPEYLGVWGNRNASRLRRLLREAMGAIEIIESEPPATMTTASRTGHRLSRVQRELAESNQS